MLSVNPIRAFQDNYIWCISDDDSKECVVVDPGDAKPVKAYLEANKLTLIAILVTHHHFDHIGGISTLLESRGVEVIGPENPLIKQITHRVRNGDTVTLLGTTFAVKEVPGHTLDHIAFFADKNSKHNTPWLFCGDTLFSAGCGRLFEGTPKQMLTSLSELAILPQSTQVFCAHEYTLSNLRFAEAVLPNNEPIKQYRQECESKLSTAGSTIPTTLKTEREINLFLNSTRADVISSVENYQKIKSDTELTTFAGLRAWKDKF